VRFGVIVAAVASAYAVQVHADAVRRVVLVNPTPDLVHAARTALAPWAIDVVERGTQDPVDATVANAMVVEESADHIVWLADGELIVVDNAGAVERRPAPAGAGDPPAAAAVALSLKTVLRLPDLPPSFVDPPRPAEPPAPVAEPIAPPSERAFHVAPEITLGGRTTSGSAGAQTRVSIGVGGTVSRFRFGAYAGFGPPADVEQAGFRGTWSDIEVGGVAGIALRFRERWTVEPRLRGAVHVTDLRGERGPEMFDRADVAAEAAADLAVRWGDRFWIEGGLGAGVWFDARAQTDGNQTIFDPPRTVAHTFVGVGAQL
jgi:hypothetical protein